MCENILENANFVLWEKIISKIISLLSKEREEDISNGNPRGEGISLHPRLGRGNPPSRQCVRRKGRRV